jgi:hypothetical protein
MIKLIAKNGSDFEQTLKEMVEQMKKNLDDGMRIIKEATGVEPESIGYRWAWGEIATFLPTMVRFKQEDWDKIDPKVMRRDKRDDNYFKPSRRYTAGNILNEKFFQEVCNHCLSDEPLQKHGIHVMFDSRSVWVQPFHDEETNRYMLLAGENLPHGFTGKAKSETQREFTIEY